MPNPRATRSRKKTKARSTPRTPRAPRGLTMAQRADRHNLYQRAVQCVEAEIDFVDATFTAIRKRKARLLREDFCGTLNTSCEWVRRRPTNVAVGVDLDPSPLEWGMTHNAGALKPAQRARLHPHQGNVLTPPPPPAGFDAYDAVLAMNFSFWCFTQRRDMLAYFRAVHASLASDGVFFMDFYGGYEALKEMRERRRVPAEKGGLPKGVYKGPFTYIWDQARYNPITGDMLCHIHFRFPDGSSLRPAFSYKWRLWTLPEIREILAEAGFKRTVVYWEGDDGKGEGNGVFTPSEEGEACPSWICYITAEK